MRFAVLLVALVLVFLVVGCAPDELESVQLRHDFNGSAPADGQLPPGAGDQREELMEQMQQAAIDACVDAVPGAACVLESPRGEMQGTCTSIDEVLSCVGSEGLPGG